MAIKATSTRCPECGEAAQKASPVKWTPANGRVPSYSHLDGEPLCPVMGPHGYKPASPRYIYA